jgi:hypothetical protein
MPSQPSTADLTRLCLELVEREEAHLAAVLESLDEVATGLRGNDAAALAASLQRQDSVVQAGLQVRQARHTFRESAARSLQTTPAAITLERVSRNLSAVEARRVLQARDRLRRLTREVEDRMRRNALLTHYYLEFLQKFFAQITGGQAQCDRYGPQGKLRPAACGFLLHARG